MIRSMTGFGRAERTGGGWSCRVEVRSVNARFLESRCRLPTGLGSCEEEVKGLIKSRCARGRFECSVTLAPLADDAAPMTLNRPLARAYGKILEQFRELTGQEVAVTLRDLVELKDLLQTDGWSENTEAVSGLVHETFGVALDGLIAMRENEGRLIAEDIRTRLDNLSGLLSRIAPLAEAYPEQMGQRLKDTLSRHLGETPLGDERILQELAILADRTDVSEEIVRFGAHLHTLGEMLGEGGPLGRKSEFVLQELNREANTLSTKCNHPEIGGLVVDVKAELEKLREQIQNVE